MTAVNGSWRPVSTRPVLDGLPANIDAEKTILGAILFDNAAYDEAVKAGLDAADFALDSHRRIFLRMTTMLKDGRAVDIVTLCETLEQHREIDTVGGRAYLFSLTEQLPFHLAVGEYVRIAKAHRRKRDLQRVAESITARIASGSPPDAIKAWALSSLKAIGEDGARESSTWAGEGMESFLADAENDIEWLIQDVLCSGCLTQIYAPRGLGKSILALHWGFSLARRGLRVLILDRDNPRHTVRQRLRGFGAENLSTLRIVSREKCPPLTQPEAWVSFPYDQFDIVIVDSLDAMTEGVGEQDGGKPARAMAPLLDICHREHGPAVLLLGNTVKSALHSRGSGVIEDRSDIVYEARDATEFRPSGTKSSWVEELPAQGAAEWTARSARRKGRTTFRLALVATKFRLGEEPAPRILEARLGDIPYRVVDVTASVDEAGETERRRGAEEKNARIAKGVATLLGEIASRSASGQPAILKTAVEAFLMKAGYTRKDARSIMGSDSFEAVAGLGKGHPVELHRREKDVTAAEMPALSDPSKTADFAEVDFRRPHLEHTAEIVPSQTRMNTGDLQPPISAAETQITDGISSAAEPGKASGEGPFLDVEV